MMMNKMNIINIMKIINISYFQTRALLHYVMNNIVDMMLLSVYLVDVIFDVSNMRKSTELFILFILYKGNLTESRYNVNVYISLFCMILIMRFRNNIPFCL